MYTTQSILKLLGVTFLVLVEAGLALASMNLWDALINPNGPPAPPSEFESNLCSLPNMDCYPCSHYSNYFAECDRIQECAFDCQEKTCKDINDPTLNKPNQVCQACDQYSKNQAECNNRPNCAFDCYHNKCKNRKDPSLDPNELNCTSQCSNPCGCQAQPGCFYSDISTSVWTGLTPTDKSQCVPAESSGELTAEYFKEWECYRGGRESNEYYFHDGNLSPLVNQEDKGLCDVENVAGEYIREFDGAFDYDGSHPCTTVPTKVSDSFFETAVDRETFGLFELVVVFDKLGDWLPAGEFRVFSVSMFNAFRWSVTLRREDFAAAEKIKIYWSFMVGSKSESDTLRYLTVKGFNQRGTYLELDPFDIQVCDQPVNSCFRGQGIVRPASITVNKFKPEGSSKTDIIFQPLRQYTASLRQKVLQRASVLLS